MGHYTAAIERLMALRREHFATHQGEGYEELTRVYLAVCRMRRADAEKAQALQNQRVAA